MKKLALTVAALAALATFAQAEATVKLTGVHLCCKSCVNGVAKAVAKVSGATASAEEKVVTVTAPDAATAQKAVDALVEAGYYGKTDDATVKLKDLSGAKDGKVSTVTLADVHLCCGKCVTAVNKAIEGVKGVTGTTAEKNAKTFEVKGDFSAREVIAALQDAGLTGKVAP